MREEDEELIVLKDAWQEGIAEDARANGFIAVNHLAFILAKDVQYNERILPSLWYDFELYKRGPAEPYMPNPRVRIESWLAILFRWATGTIAGFDGELKPIPRLAFYSYDDEKGSLKEFTSGGPYVALKDVQEYFRKVVKIPLPILLFCHWEETSVHTVAQGTSTIEYAFFKRGSVWSLVFEGKQIDGLHRKGFEYLHYLVSRQNQSFPVTELLALDGIDQATIRQKGGKASEDGEGIYDDEVMAIEAELKTEGAFDVGIGLDQTAIDDIRKKMASLCEELGKAEAESNTVLANEIREEIEKLEQYALKSKPRLKPEIEKICDMIGKRIKRAIDKISEDHPAAGTHFQKAIEPYAYQLAYKPEKTVPWTL